MTFTKLTTKVPCMFDARMKHWLTDAVDVAVKGAVVNPHVYGSARVRMFASMYRIKQNAERASVKHENLHAIPFARYYTLRQMLRVGGGEEPTRCGEEPTRCGEEHTRGDYRDAAVMFGLQQMMVRRHVSRQAMEDDFFWQIRRAIPESTFARYVDLDRRILASRLTAEEKIRFVDATSETDAFIAEKLGEDAARHAPNPTAISTAAKVAEEFVTISSGVIMVTAAGIIIAAGISIIGAACSSLCS